MSTPPNADDKGRALTAAGGFLSGLGAAGGVGAVVTGTLATASGLKLFEWGQTLMEESYYGAVIGMGLAGGGLVLGLVGVVLLVIGVGVLAILLGVGAALARRLGRRT